MAGPLDIFGLKSDVIGLQPDPIQPYDDIRFLGGDRGTAIPEGEAPLFSGLGPEQQIPNDFWSRVAQSGAQFQPPQFNTNTPGGGLLALLALASGFAQGKTNRAAGRINEVEQRNQRAREAAKTLASHRHQMRMEEYKATQNRANTERLIAGRKDVADSRSEPLVPVQGPEGIIYLPRSQAIGQPAPKKAATPERLVQVIGPGGVPIWTYASDAAGERSITTGKPVTGAERQALAFYNRAKDAGETLEMVDKNGVSLEQRIAKSGVVGQAAQSYAPNVLKTPDQRAYTQAQRAFTEARLRKESGAAIPNSEYINDRVTYFVQPGDDPATIEQKRLKRRVVLDGLRFAAGKAYEEFYGTPQPEPVGATPTRTAAPGSSGVVRWGRDAQGNPVRLP